MVNSPTILRSKFLIICSLFLSLLFIGVIIMQIIFNEVDFSFVLLGLAVAVIFPVLTLTTRILYDEKCFVLYTLRTQNKVYFSGIKSVKASSFIIHVGGYWIETYESRRFMIAMPFEHKKLAKFFTAIEMTNPGVDFDIWWYKKTRSELFKIVATKILFILAIIMLVFFSDKLGIDLSCFKRSFN